MPAAFPTIKGTPSGSRRLTGDLCVSFGKGSQAPRDHAHVEARQTWTVLGRCALCGQSPDLEEAWLSQLQNGARTAQTARSFFLSVTGKQVTGRGCARTAASHCLVGEEACRAEVRLGVEFASQVWVPQGHKQSGTETPVWPHLSWL